MKLPSWISEEPNDDPPEVFFQSFHDTLGKTRSWLLMLAAICIIVCICVLFGVIIFAMRQENAKPQLVVFTLLGLMLVSLQPLYMIAYASRIQAFMEQSNPENFWSVLDAQRRLWTLMGVFALLWFFFVVIGLIGQSVDKFL